jgi:hypothetical protein
LILLKKYDIIYIENNKGDIYMYIFLATATTWEATDEPSTTNYHVLTAYDYCDAMKSISDFYGDELQIATLEQISDMSVITISEDMVKTLKELNEF